MPPIERIGSTFGGAVLARPRTVLLLFLAGTAVLGWQARQFRLDASADTLLTRDNPHYVETQEVDRRFMAREFLMIAYQPRAQPLLSEPTFQTLQQISRRLAGLKRVESVRSILNVPLPPPDVDLAADADLSAWSIERHHHPPAQLKKLLRGHPLYEGLLINHEQTAAALQVMFGQDPVLDRLDGRITELQRQSLDHGLSREERRELAQLKQRAEPIEQRLGQSRLEELKAIRAILADYQGDADIYLGGVHVLGQQLIQTISNDLIVFGSAIGALICLVLWLLFRRVRWVLIPVVCCASSVLCTLGLFGMLDLKATVISSSFIALQLILTLAISIHLIVQYREYSATHPDWDAATLVRETLNRKAVPCFYAGFTNVVGFASLAFSTLQPVIDFGWMMSIAMFVSIATSLVLFPAMMALFGKEAVQKRRNLSHYLLDFGSWLARRQAFSIAALSGVALALGAGGLLLLDVENSFVDYFRASTSVHRELSFIDRELGGTTPLDLTWNLPADPKRKDDLVLTAKEVQTLQRIQQSLKQHDGVGKLLSVVNFTELAKKLNDRHPLTEYELSALYLSMERGQRKDLFGGFFSPEHRQLRIYARVQDTTPGLDRSRLLADIHGDLERLGIPRSEYKLTNLFVLYQDILQQLYKSQIQTLAVSFGVLALATFVIFRSLRIALICIAPNVLSTVMVLGLMGWLHIPLDFMTIMIAAIAMGITVDDTIHYIDRYLEELRGGPAETAVERTHSSVGYALLYTSLIVILGFSLLAFSDFVPSVLFGLLTGLAMFLAVLFNFTLLPVLLDRFVGTQQRAAQKKSGGVRSHRRTRVTAD